MDFNYKNYVKRYQYQAYQWPPDIGLAQLHARCSEPGKINPNGVQCPCCQRWSKYKLKKWWKRSLDQDLNGYGGAIPGYFRLLKLYIFASFIAVFINSIYPLFATYYACGKYDSSGDKCLSVGFFYFLDFKSLIELLESNGQDEKVNILFFLQTMVFYFLLFINIVSVFFLTMLQSQGHQKFEENFISDSKICLLFYNVPNQLQDKFPDMLKIFGEEGELNVRNTVKLYRLREYYDNYNHRNEIYYHLMSRYVSSQNPLSMKKHNEELKDCHQQTKNSRKQIGRFNGKLVLFFDDPALADLIHSNYKMAIWKKWWYGFRTLLRNIGLVSFDTDSMGVSSARIPKFSQIKWENIGEDLQNKMAIRIKTFLVAIFFLVLCYLILYFPMLFTLKAHSQKETKNFVQLNTLEKIIPILASLLFASMSIGYRLYMEKLSEKRNPKNELERSRFILMTTVLFHFVFYLCLPTIFFAAPGGEINSTVKLYVIYQQARTFIIVQLLILIFDIPYRLWKSNKINKLSDQRQAFKHNQFMLHKIVESKDYPLEIRLQIMFRVWSFVLLYCFEVPYMMVIIFLSFVIIFWVDKRNLYKHYTVRRKVSIHLEAQFLILYINFYCLYECTVYCLTVQSNLKIYIAVGITLIGLAINNIYWMFLRNRTKKNEEDLKSQMLKEHNAQEEGREFEENYKKFIDFIQNYNLDDDIEKYLERWELKQERKSRKEGANYQELEMSSESQSDYFV